mmetsp:Transcript_7908/g.15492  ORF Transcript_7908/g.15492 Transcript_7908/m.15492 type:complete len:173 (-) Transcript_7908:443-961(-)
MVGKQCDKCGKPYSGFGATCSECRKTKSQSGGSTNPASPGKSSGDKCVVCGKSAYVMERITVEGAIFHPACFRCKHCNNKLSTGAFSKSDAGEYYCKVHYMMLFKQRGRYELNGATCSPVKEAASPMKAAATPTTPSAVREEPDAACTEPLAESDNPLSASQGKALEVVACA